MVPVKCCCPDLVREMAGLVHIFRNFEEFRQNLDDDGIEDDVQRLAPEQASHSFRSMEKCGEKKLTNGQNKRVSTVCLGKEKDPVGIQ